MNISTLEYFITLAETLNFTKAAKYHYIAQTTMSRQIAGLEQELDTKLIERTTSSVALTDNGRIFLNDAKQIIADYEKALSNIRHTDSSNTVLKVGYCEHQESDAFLNMLETYKEQHENVDFEVIECSLSDLTRNICLKKLDAIVTFESEILGCDKLDYFNIIEHNVVAAVNRKHPLAAFDEINPALLADYDILILSDSVSTNHHKYIINCCIKDGFIPHIKDISSFTEQSILMRFNNAVAFLPDTHPVDNRFKFIKLRNTSHKYRICIAYHKENPSPYFSDFIDFTKEYYNKL